jgi:hypothetical protein
MAAALVEVVDVVGEERVLRLIGAAFSAGAWWTPLETLARIRPDLVVAVADEVGAVTGTPVSG